VGDGKTNMNFQYDIAQGDEFYQKKKLICLMSFRMNKATI